MFAVVTQFASSLYFLLIAYLFVCSKNVIVKLTEIHAERQRKGKQTTLSWLTLMDHCLPLLKLPPLLFSLWIPVYQQFIVD